MELKVRLRVFFLKKKLRYLSSNDDHCFSRNLSVVCSLKDLRRTSRNGHLLSTILMGMEKLPER